MTLTTVSAANQVKQWDSQFFREFIRENRFNRYQGTDSNAIIQLKEDLVKKPGDALTIPLVAALSGAGVTGNTLLEGSEEAVVDYGHRITINCYRHAVAIPEWEEQKTAMALRSEFKPLLKQWAMEKYRGMVLTGMGAVFDGTNYVALGSATEGNKDGWVTNNSDRILFGAAKGNLVTSDHSASLLNVDATNDKMTKEIVSLMKRMAKLADPIVRPYRVNGDEEWYVMFAGSLAFRDLKTSLGTTHTNAMERGKSNPLFTDGDLVWDGVIIREIPEIASIGAVGAASAVVAPVYLCGAQALGSVWGKRWATHTEERDYGFVRGCEIRGFMGVEKLFFNNKQHGMVTGYVATPADA